MDVNVAQTRPTPMTVTSISNSSGKTIRMDIPESAPASFEITFPPTNSSGVLTNNGTGSLSWGTSLSLSSGSLASPSLLIGTSGLYSPAAGALAFSSSSSQRLTIDSSMFTILVGSPTASSAIRFINSSATTFIQSSAEYNSVTSSPVADSFQPIKIAPYSSTKGILEISRNLINIGTTDVGNAVDVDVVGNITIRDGYLFKVNASGSGSAIAGRATLSGGAVTVSTTGVGASAIVIVSYRGSGMSNTGALSTHSIVAGTSFSISSTNVADANQVNWWIINDN